MARGRIAIGVTFGCLLLIVTGCGGGDGDDTGGDAAQAPGGRNVTQLAAAQPRDIDTFDKDGTIDSSTIPLIELLLARLFVSDASGGGVVPSLAKSHEVSRDRLTWRFELDGRAKFSDGRPITAADVKYSLDLARREEAANGFQFSSIDRISAPAPTKLEIRTKAPFTSLPAVLSIYSAGVVPEDLGGKTREEFWASPIASGPYQLDEWARGRSMSFTPNPGYVGADANQRLDSFSVSFVTDTATRLLQLRSEQVQAAIAPAPDQLPGIEADSRLAVAATTSASSSFAFPNCARGPLGDVHARRAVSLALDRSAIAKAAYGDEAVPSGGLIPPQFNDGHVSEFAGRYDVDAAKAELAQSATPDGFALTLIYDSSDPRLSRTAELMQADLAKIGIELTLRGLPRPSLVERREGGDFGMFLGSLGSPVADPTLVAGSWANAISMPGGCDASEQKRLAIEGDQEFDEAKRGKIYAQITDSVAESATAIALVHPKWTVALDRGVEGAFSISPLGSYLPKSSGTP